MGQRHSVSGDGAAAPSGAVAAADVQQAANRKLVALEVPLRHMHGRAVFRWGNGAYNPAKPGWSVALVVLLLVTCLLQAVYWTKSGPVVGGWTTGAMNGKEDQAARGSDKGGPGSVVQPARGPGLQRRKLPHQTHTACHARSFPPPLPPLLHSCLQVILSLQSPQVLGGWSGFNIISSVLVLVLLLFLMNRVKGGRGGGEGPLIVAASCERAHCRHGLTQGGQGLHPCGGPDPWALGPVPLTLGPLDPCRTLPAGRPAGECLAQLPDCSVCDHDDSHRHCPGGAAEG
jgi:hypothetical protein